MNLEKQLEIAIVEEANKLIKRYQDYHNNLHNEHLRLCKQVIDAPDKKIHTPDYWKKDKKFNPFYVKRRAKNIAKSICAKIRNKEYSPLPPHKKTIPKGDGGTRELTIYQIPDSAVSHLFYERLLNKNRHRFSSYSYAYRNDRNVHFAIQDISVDTSQTERMFIAEYDFSDFFGSIDHNSLFLQFTKNGFFISEEEIHVIQSFLSDEFKGIPQGTSISLFLANLVCWKLDSDLERQGLKFARYADDTVIWSPDYSSICKAAEIVENFSKRAGVAINQKKSYGINLLINSGGKAEITSKESFDFLGYSIGINSVSIKKKSEQKIKRKIAYLLYRNLIQPVKSKPLRALIIPSNDKDPAFLTAILQIRRYLYGGLSNKQMLEYIQGRSNIIEFKGVMSFYPLVNNEEQLKGLDGWLLSVIHRAIEKRMALLKTHNYSVERSFPFKTTRNNLVSECREKKIGGKRLLEIPSFMLIYRTLKKGLNDYGIKKVMNPKSLNYDY